MIVPGSNLLGIALGVLGAQTARYYARIGRTKDAQGVFRTTFAAPVDVVGSWQPVNKTTLSALGLDMARNHANFYSETPFSTIDENEGADEFEYAGRRWRVLNSTDWVPADGWNGVLVTDVGPIPNA